VVVQLLWQLCMQHGMELEQMLLEEWMLQQLTRRLLTLV
jgi:hypothetical protein